MKSCQFFLVYISLIERNITFMSSAGDTEGGHKDSLQCFRFHSQHIALFPFALLHPYLNDNSLCIQIHYMHILFCPQMQFFEAITYPIT